MIKTKKNIKKLIRTLDRYSPYPLFFKFRMSIDEKKTFNKYIKNSKHYLEFGSGGAIPIIMVLFFVKSAIIKNWTFLSC